MRLLDHPLTREVDLDDPTNTLLRRQIIQEKRFLHRLYDEWYALICSRLPAVHEDVLEIGSGAGYLRQFLPQLVTSEVFPLEGVDRVEDATALTYAADSLDAIVMTDVLHHIPNVAQFLREASRTLRSEGRLVMIEPWRTPWSDWVYRNLHHEPFRPDAEDWRLPPGGPLSMANGALPWMVFSRDRMLFEQQNPELEIAAIEPLMPIAYLASGGVSMRSLLPGSAYPAVRSIERRVLRESGAMFALIDVRRRAR